MARPERKDVDYFPFYVKDGRTLFILENKYGCAGTGFFTNMLRFLCQTPNHHFCIADEANRLFFFSKTKCDEVSGTAMLDLMAKTGKIYAPLWVSSRVIVSPDLLMSIKDAYTKRKNAIIALEEIISIYTENVVSGTGNTEVSEFPAPEIQIDANNRKKSSDTKRKNAIIALEEIISIHTENVVSGTGNTEVSEFPAPETQIDANNRKESSDGNPQSKVKERKEKERKRKKRSLSKFSYPKEFEEIYFAYPQNRRGSKRAAFLQYLKFKPSIPADVITVINRQKSEKSRANSLGIFYSEFPDLERWIKKANWEKDPFDFPDGNGEQPKVSPNPDCPRCRGSGLYERDRAPDGSPIMSTCHCERDNPNESQTAKSAASTLQSAG